jgi:hypothetical protein
MRWIIGDLHGMLRPLDELLAWIDERDASPAHYFLGDYVNRGPDARGVIDRLLALPRARFIRGNHDDIFDLLLHHRPYAAHPSAVDPMMAFAWFMNQGLDRTLMSYGWKRGAIERVVRRCTPQRIAELCEAIPAAHRQFIRSLPAVIEEDDFFMLHGYWRPESATGSPRLSERLDADASLRPRVLWNRFNEDEIRAEKQWDRRGYFGHTPIPTYPSAIASGNVPMVGPKIVLLDTGAALGSYGRLTACCVESDEVLQVTHFGERVLTP